ncbi:MAG TPA: crossover junction endodeoxyribonuclease RuvC [Saprospiraceae bacterium]|nr:crossover junction endodeoxyribonuclease RuvC [Saprospiraceae bacterium]MCC6688682.1 crossover junction endodeoxyribonuclease RuvC [Saprospiraceae bacterium]HMV23879.1 crossover junction endodeoxyribonuclease RuvC [Saprospiraceae bacterium]HMW74158.1 crossover junction endodeoxyribonuclease RuvC [Saprospiraceae bacterium]HMX82421.1 crossover junction endodeoxyribonuclease RuvC [Saprospiraceae bacterium]
MNKDISYKILGVDPGTNFLGFAIIETICDPPKVMSLDVINLSKYKDQQTKLLHIHREISKLIEIFHPKQLAIEEPFYANNVQSMLKLGRAQGVAIAAAINMGLTIAEYSPKKVKQSITGNGNAAKEQVARMLPHLVDMNNQVYEKLDATDALAVAVCHYSQNKLLTTSGKKYSGWQEFVKNNETRLKKS